MPPVKPFPTFKWRWLSVQPSEGLLEAPVFLGVLRTLADHEGEAFSSVDLHNDLQQVTAQTRSSVNLARTPERNLFRNSGQYWRGTGLVEPQSGEIRLTGLGRRVAEGRITTDEFLALMVRNTVLPNPLTYTSAQLQEWKRANLRIKPFELILAVIAELGSRYGIETSYVTPNELIKIMIPLSGVRARAAEIAEHIIRFRHGRLSLHDWPDCAPEANDKRLAREFLLFLRNFGICRTGHDQADLYEQKFFMNAVPSQLANDIEETTFLEDPNLVDDEVNRASDSEIPLIVERTRVATSVLQRPNQRAFRLAVFEACLHRCVVTHEQTQEVLEAAHIIPVANGGNDRAENGLCMRVDIHRLYDNGKIRIRADGQLILHDRISTAVSYHNLPERIDIPSSIASQNLSWRYRYL